MDYMFFSSPAPFLAMATSDYYPFPMHTAQNSAPLRRRYNTMTPSYTPTVHSNRPKAPERPFLSKFPSKDPGIRPKQAQRVDSGFDGASARSSITLTEEVERRHALQLFLHQYHDSENASEDDEDDEDEGVLGLKHTDSLCLIAERAIDWKDKATRTKRNRKSKSKMVIKWFKKIFVPGSDGRSWHMTL